MGKRAVKVTERGDRLSLRWSYRGERYYLALGFYDSPAARAMAESKANTIEGDMVTGNFDPTLKKYKFEVEEEPVKQVQIEVVELFQRFIPYRGKATTQRTMVKYQALSKKVLKHFGNQGAELDDNRADGFRLWLSETLSPATTREYLRLMGSCWEWGARKNLVSTNPWGDVTKRIKVPPKQLARPFSEVEIKAILKGFGESEYFGYYYDFVRFLFGAGCRISEAIGLRWEHLSEDCGKVWIGESLSRGVRKATKTNRAREFRLSHNLQAMLLERRPEQWRPSDLVFPAIGGGSIDDHNFRNRAWVKVLKEAGVSYRKPSNTRHSFISYALAKGLNPMSIAKMAGHDPEVMFEHYAADIDPGLQLPEVI